MDFEQLFLTSYCNIMRKFPEFLWTHVNPLILVTANLNIPLPNRVFCLEIKVRIYRLELECRVFMGCEVDFSN